MEHRVLILKAEFPELTREIVEFLERTGRTDLANTVPELHIVDRCRCGDSFCSTLYTQHHNGRRPGAECETLEIAPESGMIMLHIADNHITEIEVLFRGEMRQRLLSMLP